MTTPPTTSPFMRLTDPKHDESARRSLKIALDFDQTYSADPHFWDAFMSLAFALGHDVRIVTARDERFDRTQPLIELEQRQVSIIWCRGIAKRFFTTHFSDFQPDIWVDDKPESIGENSSFPPEGLKAWRAERLF